jgi:hypothetical protein
MFNPNQSIPIGAKVEISPKGFTLGVKDELGKIFLISPKLLINAELYGLVLAPKAEKKDTIEFGKPMHATLWGQCSSIYEILDFRVNVLAFISNLGQTTS